jgi:DNA-binding NtrC family response regulator
MALVRMAPSLLALNPDIASLRECSKKSGMAMARQLLLFENVENNICALLAEVAQKAGFQTQEVHTVDACLEAVRSSPPDAVLMITNNIREKCAFDVAEAIRSAHPKCGFIFSGNETDGREGFLSAGYMFHVLEIPLPLSELMSAISKAIDSPMETFVIPKAIWQA